MNIMQAEITRKRKRDEAELSSPLRKRIERIDLISSTTASDTTATLHGFPITNIHVNPVMPVCNRNLFPNILSTDPFTSTELITNPVYVPFCPVPFNALSSPFPMIPSVINSPFINPLGSGLSPLIPQSILPLPTPIVHTHAIVQPVLPVPVPDVSTISQDPIPSRPISQSVLPAIPCASDVASAVYDTISVPDISAIPDPHFFNDPSNRGPNPSAPVPDDDDTVSNDDDVAEEWSAKLHCPARRAA